MRREARPTSSRDEMVKPVDAWWTVLLVDPVATRIARPLARAQRVTPTQITLAAQVLGLASATLFAVEVLWAAAIVFELRFVLDCVDGKLARVTGRRSLLGAFVDSFGDRVVVLANIAALGWRFEPAAVAILLAAYPLHFQLLETRREALARRASRSGTSPTERGWHAALARRRLYPIPSSVEAEQLLLVVGPLLHVAGIEVIVQLLWFSVGFFSLQSARYGATIVRSARHVDRFGRPPV